MARFTIIAIGTRGDAQPAVALGKGLQSRGHQVRVLAGANFSGWIAEHGLEPAAALQAGVPAVVVPHFADQPFWGKRIQALGLGPKPIPRPKLTASRLATALQAAVTDPAMQRRASGLAGKIRAEDGIGTAVDLIEKELAK